MPVLDEAKVSQSQLDAHDALYERFEQPAFDPVQYLNDTLPPITLTSQPSTNTKQNRTTQLQSTSTEIQNILSKISTHNIRSSSELTSLTDEILRSGNRLAYEVEVLRGDANSFYELLTDTLKDDIAYFIVEHATVTEQTGVETTGQAEEAVIERDGATNRDPEFIRQLRSLGLMKARLEAVINVFGEALKWPIPPSEVSVASSLISVSAPELGVANSAEDDKAREYTRHLRNEITLLLDSDGGGYTGLEAAMKRVNDFRYLAEVWKGTSEEKARARVVETLIKIVDERKKILDARSASGRPSTDNTIRSNLPGRAGRIVEGSSNTAAGFFRKLRDDIYLE